MITFDLVKAHYDGSIHIETVHVEEKFVAEILIARLTK